MSKSQFPQGIKPILVEWDDSVHTGGWWSKREALQPCDPRCVTVGHEIARSKKSIIIALSRHASSDGHIIEIPATAIRRIRKLKV